MSSSMDVRESFAGRFLGVEDLRHSRYQDDQALIPSPQTFLHMRGRPPRQQRAPSSTKAQLMVAKHGFKPLDGAVREEGAVRRSYDMRRRL